MPLRTGHPAQLVVLAFAVAVVVGTAVLLLPAATAGPGNASATTALFTATSAVCVTGLIVADTPTYWSHFGQAAILGLIQVGGFGIMSLTSLLALVVARRLGLRTRLVAQLEAGALELGEVRRVLVGVAILTVIFETAAAVVLTARFYVGYEEPLGAAVWRGVFHSVSAFNNAGFALWSDNLVGFATDWWVSLTVAFTIIAGGLGFPVWLELARRRLAVRRWSLHTKLTLLLSGALTVLGTLAVLAFEYRHAETVGGLGLADKLLVSFFQGVTPRTAGFNTLDYAQLEPETLLVTDVLMFVGTGSAATGGGIKVTTLAVLALMVLAELRGEREVTAFGRRIPPHAQRQALAVAFVGLSAVAAATLALMATSAFGLSDALFEAVSAFGTVGLSTGITADLGEAGRVILVALVFLGRIGPHTIGVALVLRERDRLYRVPEDRPLIG